MDSPVVIGVIAFLVVIFGVISVWQKKLDQREHVRNVEEKKDAQERGTHKAISQFPLINPYLCIGCTSCIAACPEEGVIGMIDGVAQVIHGSRCVGHALCEVACPVGAIKVGLGNIALRPDIPILSPAQESTVPGVFIAGELGGISLIRNAVTQGSKVVDEIAARLKKKYPTGQNPDILDVLIIGAGPAGLSASLRAVEHNLKYLTIDQEDAGGTIRKYPRRKLTLVQELNIPLHGKLKGGEYEKEYLVDLWKTIIEKHNLRIKTKMAFQSLSKNLDGFEIQTSLGSLKARTVLLAMGRRGTPRRLGVPGEDLAKVFYQLVDAATYQKQHLLIVGGGDSAIEAATALANQPGNVVTLSYRQKNFFRLKKRNEDRINEYVARKKIRLLLNSNVLKIETNTVEVSVYDANDKKLNLPNNYVFIFAGGEPPFPLLKKIGVGFGGNSKMEKIRSI